MGDIHNLSDYQSGSQGQQSMNIYDMIGLLDKYKAILEQFKESQEMSVTINEESYDFAPQRICVVLGDGSLVLQEGMENFNSVELLGLKQFIQSKVFEES